MATHSSIFAWIIPMDRGSWRATSMGSHRVWHDRAAQHSAAQHAARMGQARPSSSAQRSTQCAWGRRDRAAQHSAARSVRGAGARPELLGLCFVYLFVVVFIVYFVFF